MGVIVDLLFAPSAPLTQREKQPGTGRWTQVIQNSEDYITGNNTQVEGENDSKGLSSALNNTTEIFKTLWFCLCKAFIIKKQKPSKIVYPVLVSMSFILGDAFCYQQQRGHKHTKLPGQGKVSDSELEVMNTHAGYRIIYHFPAPGVLHISRCTGEMQQTNTALFWRTARFTYGFAPTANVLLRSAGRVGYTSAP